MANESIGGQRDFLSASGVALARAGNRTEKGTSYSGNQLGKDMFLAAENMTKKVP